MTTDFKPQYGFQYGGVAGGPTTSGDMAFAFQNTPDAPHSDLAGKAGIGLQVLGAGYSFHATMKAASGLRSQARKQAGIERLQVMAAYTNALQQLGDEFSKVSGAQRVAVAASGLTPSGSANAVLIETESSARKQEAMLNKQMQEELAAIYLREHEAKREAKAMRLGAKRKLAFDIAKVALMV